MPCRRATSCTREPGACASATTQARKAASWARRLSPTISIRCTCAATVAATQAASSLPLMPIGEAGRMRQARRPRPDASLPERPCILPAAASPASDSIPEATEPRNERHRSDDGIVHERAHGRAASSGQLASTPRAPGHAALPRRQRPRRWGSEGPGGVSRGRVTQPRLSPSKPRPAAGGRLLSSVARPPPRRPPGSRRRPLSCALGAAGEPQDRAVHVVRHGHPDMGVPERVRAARSTQASTVACRCPRGLRLRSCSSPGAACPAVPL